jgi:hypothetical protein
VGIVLGVFGFFAAELSDSRHSAEKEENKETESRQALDTRTRVENS